jgi:hypothetical protein
MPSGYVFKAYHRFGDKSWNPGRDIPPRTQKPKGKWRPTGAQPTREGAAARRAEFSRLRAGNVSVAEAGEQVGVAPGTADKYEQRRKREAGGAA